jgi:hypothetical protein
MRTDLRFNSIDNVRSAVQSFRSLNCDNTNVPDSVRQKGCRIADEANAKITNAEAEKIAQLMQEVLSRDVAERAIQGDIRVGDDHRVTSALGSPKETRHLKTTTGETTRSEYAGGTVVYVKNGRVIAITD